MTYKEAKSVVNSGEFNSCYARVGDKKKIFKKLYDDGPFKSATRTFEQIKDDEEAFRSGDTNLYYTLVENYENDLNFVYGKVAECLLLAQGYCTSIQNGMDIDRSALSLALTKEEEVFDSLEPHIRADQIDTAANGDPIYGKPYDHSSLDRAEAEEAAEDIWYDNCCAWSK